MKGSLKRRFGQRFRAGTYAVFASAVVLCIAIALNVMAGSLPDAMTQLDMTAQNLYSLSEQTRQIVRSLDRPVALYLLAVEGNEDETILRLLNRYADLSGQITVSCVDPTVQPTFLTPYELDVNQLYANSVLVDGGGRFRLVGYDDIYVTSYAYDANSYYGYSSTTSFDGENALTNAIHYVASDDLPKVYTLTGHGEAALSESLNDMLAHDNLTVEELSLLSLDAMPEDADALVINAPQNDLNADEAALLSAWLENGGRMVLLTHLTDPESIPNLLSVTKRMGLTAGQGLVLEGNAQMRVNRYPHYLLPAIGEHEITSDLSSQGYYLLTPLAHPLEEVESEATVTWLLTTSENGYVKLEGMDAATTQLSEGDPQGSFHVAAASEWNDARLVWFASGEMLDDSVDRVVAGANGNAFVNAVNWMCGQTESISIRAKSLDVRGLTVSSAAHSLWSAVLVGAVPVCAVLLGVAVCIRRRKK